MIARQCARHAANPAAGGRAPEPIRGCVLDTQSYHRDEKACLTPGSCQRSERLLSSSGWLNGRALGPAASRSAPTSWGRSGLYRPLGRLPSSIGPILVRTNRRTSSPTAAHIRRTCRFLPSWITIRSQTPSRPDSATRTPARGSQTAVDLDARSELSQLIRTNWPHDEDVVLPLDLVGWVKQVLASAPRRW